MEVHLNTFHIGITCDIVNGKVLFSALKLQQCVEIDGIYSQIKPTAIMTALKHISVYLSCTRVYFKLYNGIIQHKVYVHIAFRKYSFPLIMLHYSHTLKWSKYICFLFNIQKEKNKKKIQGKKC